MPLPVRTSSLHRIDRIIFAPVCWLLTMFRRVLEPPTREGTGVRSIVFIKLAEQGSTVLAAAALRRAVELCGRENVYFAAFEENRFIQDVMDLIPKENLLTVPTDSLWSMGIGTLRVISRVWKIKIDAAVDLEFFARFSAAITFLTRARWRAGLHAYYNEGPYRGDLMTHRLLYNPHIHTSDMFLALVESLNHPGSSFPTFDFQPDAFPDAAPPFKAKPGEIAEMEALLRRETGQQTIPRMILLNPNASDLIPLRRWPLDNYRELARQLLDRFPDTSIIMTGAPDERDAVECLARSVNSSRCISLAGKTTLRQLLVLYILSEVLVTNDSGPAHFAALTPIRVVILFGPETPDLFAPRTPRATPISLRIACSPCVNALNNRQSACTNNLCMKNISVTQVYDAVCLSHI